MKSTPILTRFAVGCLCVVLMAIVGVVDWISGYDLVFVLFYILPVALGARHFGRLPVGLLALGGGMTWFVADRLSGHSYRHPLYAYWNAFMLSAMLLTIGLLLKQLAEKLEAVQAANRELNRLLEEVRRSNQQIRELQANIQVVCAWTKQIKIQGQWMTIDEFLSRHLQLQLSHGISPEALKKFLAESGLEPDAPDAKGPPGAGTT